MEQQIYSKEFLNFVTEIINLHELNDIDYKNFNHNMYYREKMVPNEKTPLYENILNISIQMYNTIMSHSSENSCIAKFTENMIRIMTNQPILAYNFLKDNFATHKINHTCVMLMTCSDSTVRKSTSKLLAYATMITIEYEDIDLQAYSIEELDMHQMSDYTPNDKNYVVLSFLWRMLKSININENENFYKKCRGYFKLWHKLCEKNEAFVKWFITIEGISRFIEFYMEKKGSNYDRKQGFSLHEHALEP